MFARVGRYGEISTTILILFHIPLSALPHEARDLHKVSMLTIVDQTAERKSALDWLQNAINVLGIVCARVTYEGT